MIVHPSRRAISQSCRKRRSRSRMGGSSAVVPFRPYSFTSSELNTARASRTSRIGRTSLPSSRQKSTASVSPKQATVILTQRYSVFTSGDGGIMSNRASSTPSMSLRWRKHQESSVEPLDWVPPHRKVTFLPEASNILHLGYGNDDSAMNLVFHVTSPSRNVSTPTHQWNP